MTSWPTMGKFVNDSAAWPGALASHRNDVPCSSAFSIAQASDLRNHNDASSYPWAVNTIGDNRDRLSSIGKNDMRWEIGDRNPGKRALPANFLSRDSAQASGQNRLFDGILDLMKIIGAFLEKLFSSTPDEPASIDDLSQGGGGGGGTGGYANAAPASYRSNGSSSSSGPSGSDTSFKGSFDPSNSGFSKTAPPPGQGLSQAEGDTLAAKTMTSLMKDLNLTAAQAAGVVGNLKHESGGMNPHINEIGSGGQTYGPPNGSQFGYGWAQWTGGRKTDFLNYARANKLDPGSPAANYGFLVQELRTTESQSLSALKNTSSAREAAITFRAVFERAGIPNDSSRIASAETLFAAYNNRRLA